MQQVLTPQTLPNAQRLDARLKPRLAHKYRRVFNAVLTPHETAEITLVPVVGLFDIYWCQVFKSVQSRDKRRLS